MIEKLSITNNIAMTTLSMMDAAPENSTPHYPYRSFPNISKTYDDISEYISSHNLSVTRSFKDKFELGIYFTICIVSVFGAVGNGLIIWLLGFRVKRNPFITYILNLAVADFGVLLSAVSFGLLYISLPVWFVFYMLFQLMYSASQFLLTAISIDRCVAVFFPLWHQCKRPPHLSTIVCALIWVFSILLTGITCILHFLNRFVVDITNTEKYSQYLANAVLCLPIMMTATAALFIKVCLKTQQHRRRRLLTVILLTLLFFLLFAFPLNVMSTLCAIRYVPGHMRFGAALLACLNSSVNPVIYFLVGRQWRSRRRENMKMILQKVFKEEEGSGEEASV